MPYEIRDHPDAPPADELVDYTVEPVPPERIADRREQGFVLAETNLLDHEAIDAYVELTNPQAVGNADIGTVLYRLVQLFGTPQFPEYRAGTDISHRTDVTFKYLLRVRSDAPDGGDEWLITVHDWHVRLGVSLATWTDDPGAGDEDGDTPAVEPDEALPLLALVVNVVTDPVQCEYEDKLF